MKLRNKDIKVGSVVEIIGRRLNGSHRIGITGKVMQIDTNDDTVHVKSDCSETFHWSYSEDVHVVGSIKSQPISHKLYEIKK